VTSFQEILRAMVERVPGATGAIFADWDGEPVGTFAPETPALDLEIAGAQWGVVWMQMMKALERAQLGQPLELEVDGEKGTVLVHQVTESYYVVLTMKRGSHLATAQRELRRSVASLRAEM
jgi:predicted regulator of Ras-like GTPase activity (Roadblock/LC7/MglB family)